VDDVFYMWAIKKMSNQCHMLDSTELDGGGGILKRKKIVRTESKPKMTYVTRGKTLLTLKKLQLLVLTNPLYTFFFNLYQTIKRSFIMGQRGYNRSDII